MRILVYGAGYVGLTTSLCLAEKGHMVTCIDINKDRISKLNTGILPIFEKDMQEFLNKNLNNKTITYKTKIESIPKDTKAIFICVGTPEDETGKIKLSNINEIIEQLVKQIKNDCVIIIKSTVPVGTCDRIQEYVNKNKVTKKNIEIVSNPEFLSQGNAIKDTLENQRIIIGAESEHACQIMQEIYKDFKQEKMITTRKNSEMIKYASNAFLALKVSYINEIANLCENVGADIDKVAEGMGLDNRIGKSFLNAGIGYGGSCYPKDTNTLLKIAEDNNVKIKLIEDTIKINEQQNIRLYERAKNIYKSLNGLNIAILGVTFKPETDDLRNAPSTKNINLLLKDRANITVYDPKGIENCKKIFKDKLKYANSIQECLENTDICFIFSEWKEIKQMEKRWFIEYMKTPEVFDGRNCFDIEEMKKLKIKYYSIGRG